MRFSGYSLIELLIASAIGLGLSVALIALYHFSLRVVVKEQSYSGAMQEVSTLESFLRGAIPYGQFHPACSSILPTGGRLYLGVSRRELLERALLERPVSIVRGERASYYNVSKPAIESVTVAGRDLSKLAGSDLLILNNLAALESTQKQGSYSFSRDQESLQGYRWIYLYMTDCDKGVLLVAERMGDYFVLSAEDQRLVRRIFEGEERLQTYHLYQRGYYLAAQEGIALVVDGFDLLPRLRFDHFYRWEVTPLDRKGRAISLEEEYERLFALEVRYAYAITGGGGEGKGERDDPYFPPYRLDGDVDGVITGRWVFRLYNL